MFFYFHFLILIYFFLIFWISSVPRGVPEVPRGPQRFPEVPQRFPWRFPGGPQRSPEVPWRSGHHQSSMMVQIFLFSFFLKFHFLIFFFFLQIQFVSKFSAKVWSRGAWNGKTAKLMVQGGTTGKIQPCTVVLLR